MKHRRCGVIIAVLVLAPVWGCAPAHGNRFIHRSTSGPIEVMEGPIPIRQDIDESVQRAIASAEKPARTPIPTIESRDPELRSALRALAEQQSAGNHVRVGNAYRAVRVYDRALDHYDAALTLDKRVAAAYDGRARIWRDWGLLAPALADATRATFHAPDSAGMRNTFATVLMALGRCGAAARVLEQIVDQDPNASYATTNLAILSRIAVQEPERCIDGAVTGSRERGAARERRASSRE